MSILAICSKRRQKKVETPKLSLKVTTVGNCLGDQRRISCCEGSRFFVSGHLFFILFDCPIPSVICLNVYHLFFRFVSKIGLLDPRKQFQSKTNLEFDQSIIARWSRR